MQSRKVNPPAPVTSPAQAGSPDRGGPAARTAAFLLRGAVALLATGDRDGRRVAGLALLLAGAALVFVGAAIGCVHQALFGHDVPVLLDGAWRVYLGQRPHTDFSSAVGFLGFAVVALAMKLTSPTAEAIAAGNGLLAIVLMAWTWVLGRVRLPPLFAALLALYAGALVLGVYPLGQALAETSYAMLYNRWGWALLLPLLVELFAPRAGPAPSRVASIGAGASSGAAAVLLLADKITFFPPALALIALAALRKRSRDWALGVGAALLAGGLIVLAWLRFDPGPMWSDFSQVARARSTVIDLSWHGRAALAAQMEVRSLDLTLGRILATLYADRVALVAIALLLVLPWGTRPDRWRWVAVPAVLGATYAVVLSSWQWGEVPTDTFCVLLLAAGVLAQAGAGWRKPVAAAVAVLVVGQLLSKEARGLAGELRWRRRELARVPASDRMRPAPLAGLVISEGGGNCRINYGRRVDDGLALLARSVGTPSTVASLDSSSLFSFGLQWPVAHRSVLYWAYPASFTPAAHTPPDVAFADVDLLMFPKCPEDELTLKVLTDVYGPWLQARYAPLAESDHWSLLRRREAGPPPAGRASGR